jgi:hypothetical protein
MKIFILLFTFLALFTSCDDDSSNTTTNNTNNINNINNQNTCGDIGGTAFDYAFSEIYIPVTSSENIGIDLDGDGVIDNKLGNLMQTLISSAPEFDMNGAMQENINEGTTAILARLVVEKFTTPGDGDISGTIYKGSFTGDSTETIFNGDGEFLIDEESLNTPTLCGRVYGAGVTELGPGMVTVTFPISDTDTLLIHLNHAQMKGITSEDGWNDMIIAGAISPSEIRDSLLPAFVDEINETIQNDPQGSTFITETFDNSCNAEIEGCSDLTECISDGIITLQELQCNDTINIILTPDVTIDGVDYVSMGVRVQAVKAIISNL